MSGKEGGRGGSGEGGRGGREGGRESCDTTLSSTALFVYVFVPNLS